MARVTTDVVEAVERIRQRRMLVAISSISSVFMTWAMWLFTPRKPKYKPNKHYMRGPGPMWHAKHRSS